MGAGVSLGRGGGCGSSFIRAEGCCSGYELTWIYGREKLPSQVSNEITSSAVEHRTEVLIRCAATRSLLPEPAGSLTPDSGQPQPLLAGEALVWGSLAASSALWCTDGFVKEVEGADDVLTAISVFLL